MIMQLLIYVLEMSLSFTALYSVYYLVLRHSTFHNWQRAYLLLTPMLSILIPLARMPEIIRSQAINIDLTEVIVRSGSISPDNGKFLDLKTCLLLAYILGCLCMMIRLGFKIYRLALISTKARYNAHWNIQVAQPENFRGAGSFFHILFLAPDQADTINPVIIEHELIHIRHKHWLDIVYTQLFTCLNWFNPLSYSLLNSLKLQHEFIADQQICRNGSIKHEYQELLFVESFGSINSLEFIHSFSKPSYLKIRIMKLNQVKSAKSQLLYYLGVLPVLFVLVVSAMFFSGQATASGLVNQAGELIPSKLKASEMTQKGAVQDTDAEKVYLESETPPAYPGGDIQLITDLGNNVTYPAEAKAKGVEGIILVKFIVEKNGSVSAVHIIKGQEIGFGLPEAALKAVYKLNKFQPGIIKGQPVRVSYTVPLRFKLERSTNKKTGYNKSANPLYLVDGKDMSYAEVIKIKTETIKSVNVLKKLAATEKYGAGGENGAVEITMKELKQ